jgi:hypothetical protein
MEFEFCANCMEDLYENNGVRCIECRKASYCNQACQKAHWKMHKNLCKLQQRVRLEDSETDQKRTNRLFDEWLKEGQKDILGQLFLGYYGWDTLKALSMAEPARRSLVCLKVDFNYNWRTFLLTDPPELIPPVRVDDAVAEQMHSMCDDAQEIMRLTFNPAGVEWACIVACVLRSDKSPTLVGIYVDHNGCVARAPFESLSENLKGITLTSKKFRKWTPLSNKNVSKQIKAIQEDDIFTLFWSYALHMRCAEPRDTSHIIKVDWEEGWGLGEIKKLKRFRVVTKEEAVAEYEEKYHGQEGFDIEFAKLQLALQHNSHEPGPNSKMRPKTWQ